MKIGYNAKFLFGRSGIETYSREIIKGGIETYSREIIKTVLTHLL